MSTHASWNAIATLAAARDSRLFTSHPVRACDWVEDADLNGDYFDAAAAAKLVGEYPTPLDREMPSCFVCAAFVDAALIARDEVIPR